MSYLKDWIRRLGGSWHWVAAQYVLTLLLILAGLAWTRLGDKHWWQVALTLLVPLLLAICVLELQAGTMRAFADDDGRRVKLVFGAMTLLVWVALFWACWALLDWCDDRISLWAGYVNSKASAGERATVLTYAHLEKWMTVLEWVLRWIVVPGKLIPYAIASAQWSWRIPFRRMIRLLLNWRWWPAVVVAALVGVMVPGHFFAGVPHGTVTHQIWAVGLKLAASYVLVVGVWVLLLGWAAVLLARTAEPSDSGLDRILLEKLSLGKKWIWGLAGWMTLSFLVDFGFDALPEGIRSSGWAVAPVAVVMIVAMLLLQVGFVRSMMQLEHPVKAIWGVLSVLLWLAVAAASAIALGFWHHEVAGWVLAWIGIPALLVPFAAGSAAWGLLLPWRRILSVACSWNWWFGVPVAAIVGNGLASFIPYLLSGGRASENAFVNTFWNDVTDPLTLASYVVLTAWFVVLLARTATAGVTASPLPEGGDDAGGNA